MRALPVKFRGPTPGCFSYFHRFFARERNSDNFEHRNCVILRESCKLSDCISSPSRGSNTNALRDAKPFSKS